MTRKTAVVICPGRGTYNATELGYLSRHFPDAGLLSRFEALRQGQESLVDLDSAASFSLSRHGRGDNASALIYAASYGDFLSLDLDVVAVTGNSMGWYTALACAGAVTPEHGFQIANTMGRLMALAPGGQLIHPHMGEDWRPDPARKAALLALVADIATRPDHALALSIDLGGFLVLAGDEAGLKAFEAATPREGRFPLRLAHHAAFHTSLMVPIAAKGRDLLPEGLFATPRLPLIDGRGQTWWPGAQTPAQIRDYTLGHQVTEAYDFTAAIRTAARDFAPDVFVLTGPGTTLGGATLQALILANWRGLSCKTQAQAQNPLLSIALPDQRILTGAQS
jgi:[acyl-carrier-protein] S-malonyltransferase